MQVSPSRTPRASGAYVGGAVLIVIGLVALFSNLTGIEKAGDAIPLGIGLAFMVAYAMTRSYGFLVPGAILTGVGSGILAASLAGANDNGVYVGIAGGLGFLLIYAIDILVSRVTQRWWPVIPGAAMLVITGETASRSGGLIGDIGLWSPLLLVVIGVWILIARGRSAKG